MEDNKIKKEPQFSNFGADDIDTNICQTVPVQTDHVIACLRKQGFRITKQRRILIDIILNGYCSCCKEVYILATKKDPGIGIATVYRTVDALEKIGALKRGTAYQLCDHKNRVCQYCLVELEDSSTVKLDCNSMEMVIRSGMQNSGLSDGKKVVGITWMQEDSEEDIEVNQKNSRSYLL